MIALTVASAAHGAFPGANGRIAFHRIQSGLGNQIYSANPDGTGAVNLSDDGDSDTQETNPAWAPDGTRIAFMRTRGTPFRLDIWVMEADGSNQLNLTPDPPDATTRIDEYTPAWSPDGTRIAFVRYSPCFRCPETTDVWTMNADGTDQTNLTDTPFGQPESEPAWSPVGNKIAFSRFDSAGRSIYAINADGTGGEQQLTSTGYNWNPNWSPDGRKIVFQANRGGNLGLWVMNADGSGQTQITVAPDQNQGEGLPAWAPDGTKIVFQTPNELATVNPDGSGRAPFNPVFAQPGSNFAPDWQPIPYTGYPRPRGATPLRASLVPAYASCSSPNSTHGSPLAIGSCAPPLQASGYATVGTPPQDPANSIGSVTAKATATDVQFVVSVTDVRNKTSLTDYIGELETRLPLRITDRNNVATPGGDPAAATTQDGQFSFAVPCATTADTTIGSHCSVTATANTMLPGAVTANLRTIWQLEQIAVYDGGPDGDADTPAGNTLFMNQGVFVP